MVMVAYLIMGTQIFQTLFQDMNSNYKDFYHSLRSMFDSMIGVYGYSGSNKDEYLYSFAMWLNLFILFIVLLNFMIAILSDTYANMLESGTFQYKCVQYQYCERYTIAFKDHEYGEMVIHAPTGLKFGCRCSDHSSGLLR
jgi:hypothetical protein